MRRSSLVPYSSKILLVVALGSAFACRTASRSDSGVREVEVEPQEADDGLDARFGVAYPPAYSKTWETNPDGTTITNPGLQHCMEGQGVQLDAAKMQIWADLEDGSLVVGEEVVVGTAPNGKPLKLGHPTITGGRNARIAGEVKWKNGAPLINNKSGRYSAHPDRGPTQLANAAALFQTCGWSVSTKYADMTPGDE